MLRDDGTLWLNLGDSYASFRDGKATPDTTRGESTGTLVPKGEAKNRMASTFAGSAIKHKDLVGIPWRVAFALQSDGWYLRQDIIWSKRNPMPESVTDRCTKSHEYIFLMSKSAKYYYDAAAIAEPVQSGKEWKPNSGNGSQSKTCEDKPKPLGPVLRNEESTRVHGNLPGRSDGGRACNNPEQLFRNKRSVWTVSTKPYREAHFATFPPALIRPCILAGCPAGGIVLDPFGGSGTVGEVCEEEGRNTILIELNPKYIDLIKNRTAQGGLFLQ